MKQQQAPIQPSLFDAPEPPTPTTLAQEARREAEPVQEPEEAMRDRQSLMAWEDFIAGVR